MELLTGKAAIERMQGVLNAKYQVHGTAVDLTVKNIFAVDPVGQVDFGGSEYKPAGRVPIASLRYNREDRYEWWNLERGCYLVEFNESLVLPDNEVAMLEPEERLLRAGALHPSHFIRGKVSPIETLLEVNIMRIQIKQNARISRVRIFRLPAAVATTQGQVPEAPAKPAKKKK